ncbi:hypothetical protein TELCIR_05476 [Teladorsagia circumcincta]|uniref:Uncharacterized protein n=1 Tax=Teladorsagia circumcincta TaxID=45464 RepID=A0A2G9UQR7_TELCI|nr:hypothetical protein TELCIR_05476 [Teladorsagia circumcincta]
MATSVFLRRLVGSQVGRLAPNDHDILDFSVSSLITDSRPSTPSSLPQDEKAKYQEEFEKQMKEFEAERAKFKEQHPDKAKDDDDYDDSKFYEDATVRELRQLFESQGNILQGAPQGGGGGGGVDHTMHQKVDSLLNEVRAVRANQLQHSGGGAVSCPNITCLSSSLFLAVILIQGLVIVVMIFVRSKPDKAKFY